MNPGQTVNCDFDFSDLNTNLLGNHPTLNQHLVIDVVKQFNGNIFLRFGQYDIGKVKVYFNSEKFSLV